MAIPEKKKKNARMTSYCLQEQAEFFTIVLQSLVLSIQPILITIFKIPLKYKQYGLSHKKNTYTQFINIFSVFFF